MDLDSPSFLSSAGLVLIGAFLAWFFGQFQETQRERRLRASLATALLAEFRWARAMLVGLAENPDFTTVLELPVLDGGMASITVFTPSTAAFLTGFLTNLRRLRDEMSLKREPEAIRILAAIAVSRLPELCSALQADGGVMPTPPGTEPIGVDDIPRLLSAPSPF